MATIDINPKKPVTKDRQTKLMVMSFRLMRLVVGILGLSIGILLPALTGLLSQCSFIQESISHYYYTIAGDVFVGLLCAVAFFLILYPGDGRWEDLWTNGAGICALGIALFPTGYNQLDNACTKYSFEHEDWVSKVHLACAGSFFIILGIVAFFQFPWKTNTNGGSPIRAKAANFYKGCGLVMWLCILTLLPMTFLDDYGHYLSLHKLVFAVEVIALVAFGTCWLKKGSEVQPS